VTKCDERAKQATKSGKAVIIENRRKSEATKLEAAKDEVLLYIYNIFYFRLHNMNRTSNVRKQNSSGHFSPKSPDCLPDGSGSLIKIEQKSQKKEALAHPGL
jgi:hypothetical protein